MKKVFAIAVSVVLCVAMLCSCGKKNSIVGQWERASDSKTSTFRYLYFYDDGTYSSGHSNYKGTYSISGNNIRLEGFLVDDVNAKFEVNGDTLTLEYWARSETYTRVED